MSHVETYPSRDFKFPQIFILMKNIFCPGQNIFCTRQNIFCPEKIFCPKLKKYIFACEVDGKQLFTVYQKNL